MSFAIYGESNGYVHLVSELTREEAVQSFLDDVKDTGVNLGAVYNVYAVEGRQEDKDLEDLIEKLIKDAPDDV